MIDTIIFDIDGVLIDVSRSFRLVIAMVVADYFKTFEGYFGPSIITPQTTQVFKDRGGFNNDWELTEAAILLCYYYKEEYGRFLPIIDLPDWYQGGGLEELYQKTGLPRLNQNWIKRRFQIFYAGKRYCSRLYGFEPEEEITGLIEKERIVLRREFLSERFRYGIATGRTEAETYLALEKMGLEPSFFEAGIVWAVRKPDPTLLYQLVFDHGVYIGDTIDDLRMVQGFAHRKRTLSLVMVKPPFRKEIEIDQPDILFIADNVNDALLRLDRDRGEWT
ncbi:hypothetical protein DRP53_06895 [candidate division WOR-3 bacterium]|uniref:HAD family hydrolase n=1 Tax=candidate division WOR-3 bacterium TaxID=2052148 RepID=A0A660SGT3_UNCW3|nr:MAG: hypothetical protein DRP53_06895 [candidate division WOR-3 bacterium]